MGPIHEGLILYLLLMVNFSKTTKTIFPAILWWDVKALSARHEGDPDGSPTRSIGLALVHFFSAPLVAKKITSLEQLGCYCWKVPWIIVGYHLSKDDKLLGGWTNPFEKYERQNGWKSSPIFGVNIKNIWVATTQTLTQTLTWMK